MRQPARVFAYRLAKELGIYDVEGMLRGMASHTFFQWAAYYRLEPWGEERADIRSGTAAAGLAQVLGAKRARPKDFIAQFRQPATQSQASILAALKSWGAAGQCARSQK